MPYEVRRDGSPMTVEVTWAVPSIGSALIEGWGFVVFTIVFVLVVVSVVQFVLHNAAS